MFSLGRVLLFLILIIGSSNCLVSNFRGIDHIGITVPNITEAILFFQKGFDCTFVMTLGPFVPNENWMNAHLNVDRNASISNITFIRCGNGSNIELFQYEVANQNKSPANNSDYGGHHLAFYVDNITSALAQLKNFSREININFMDGPTLNADASSGGLNWIYLTTKWGLQIELVSYPNGMAYEKSSNNNKLWNPSRTEITSEVVNEGEITRVALGVIIILAAGTIIFPILGFYWGRKVGSRLAKDSSKNPLNENSI